MGAGKGDKSLRRSAHLYTVPVPCALQGLLRPADAMESYAPHPLVRQQKRSRRKADVSFPLVCYPYYRKEAELIAIFHCPAQIIKRSTSLSFYRKALYLIK